MDILSLRERRSDSVMTVSELNCYVKNLLESDRLLGAVTVKGEISNFKAHTRGHFYFTIKDENTRINAVMFSSSASRIKFTPTDGMKVLIKDKVNGYVYRITDDGLNFIDEHYNIIFVHKSNTKKEYRVGEYIDGRIININQNFENEYTATTIEQKELVLEDDKKTIMDYIDSHFGVIPFSENTTPEVIERVFKMSKAAFKRAIGSLYKDKLIIIEEERIISSKMINWSNTFNKK